MYRKILAVICILALLIIFSLSFCIDNEVKKNYELFKESYLKITDVFDAKEPIVSIKRLNKEPISEEFRVIKDIAEKLCNEASSQNEKKLCSNISRYMEGLEFLQYAAKNFDTLSEDERGRITTELVLVEMRRNSIKRGEE